MDAAEVTGRSYLVAEEPQARGQDHLIRRFKRHPLVRLRMRDGQLHRVKPLPL